MLVPNLPSETNTLDDTDFGAKVDFRKTGEPGERKPRSQIEINQSQPAYELRIEPRSQWWEARMRLPKRSPV